MHFWNLELPLERLGRHLDVILKVLRCFGVPFWVSAGALGRLRRAMAFKDPWWLSASLLFVRFWRRKGAQKASKMENANCEQNTLFIRF